MSNGKRQALLFGLNYAYSANKLNGCINDVKNIAEYLTNKLTIQCTVFTDDNDLENTSGIGIIRQLHALAVASYRDSLEVVYIHYSGHGSYMQDKSYDELDGRDECLVPSDFLTAGLIRDDYINDVIALFNPLTRVICVFDCCHSGTIGDLKYSWESPKRAMMENALCDVRCKAITISGCLDKQVSMDAFNVNGDNSYTGALTSCLIMVLREDPLVVSNVFTLITKLRSKLTACGFQQIAKLCSSHNLAKDCIFIPKN